MKKCCFLLFFLITNLTSIAQSNLFKGNWYAGIEAGAFSNQTRMVAGELGKYTAGGSGILPIYGLKLGYNYNPSLSLETGIAALPLNLVFIYQTNRVVGGNYLNFMALPIRLNYKFYTLNKKIEAFTSVGIQYVYHSTIETYPFNGEIIATKHTAPDTLSYTGSVEVLRRNAFNVELGLGINWILSKRWAFTIYGRQSLGLMNIALVDISIKDNQNPVEAAQFVSRGSGLTIGFGVRYNFKKK
jgi:hypothetical protein